jgi:hypothetical protein
MDLIWLLIILGMSNETLAARLLAESGRLKESDPNQSMNLRKQAYRLIGLLQEKSQ